MGQLLLQLLSAGAAALGPGHGAEAGMGYSRLFTDAWGRASARLLLFSRALRTAPRRRVARGLQARVRAGQPGA